MRRLEKDDKIDTLWKWTLKWADANGYASKSETNQLNDDKCKHGFAIWGDFQGITIRQTRYSSNRKKACKYNKSAIIEL